MPDPKPYPDIIPTKLPEQKAPTTAGMLPKAKPQPAIPTETDWATLPLKTAESLLEQCRASAESGAKIVASRIHTERQHSIERCIVCRKVLPSRVEHGGATIYKPVYMQNVQDKLTGMWKRQSICTQQCFIKAVRQGLLNAPGGMTPQIAAPQLPASEVK